MGNYTKIININVFILSSDGDQVQFSEYLSKFMNNQPYYTECKSIVNAHVYNIHDSEIQTY